MSKYTYDALLKELRTYANEYEEGTAPYELIMDAVGKIEQQNRLICKLIENRPKPLPREKERDAVHGAVEAIKRCVKRGDMETVLVLANLCKIIAGDRFGISAEPSENCGARMRKGEQE